MNHYRNAFGLLGLLAALMVLVASGGNRLRADEKSDADGMKELAEIAYVNALVAFDDPYYARPDAAYYAPKGEMDVEDRYNKNWMEISGALSPSEYAELLDYISEVTGEWASGESYLSNGGKNLADGNNSFAKAGTEYAKGTPTGYANAAFYYDDARKSYNLAAADYKNAYVKYSNTYSSGIGADGLLVKAGH